MVKMKKYRSNIGDRRSPKQRYMDQEKERLKDKTELEELKQIMRDEHHPRQRESDSFYKWVINAWSHDKKDKLTPEEKVEKWKRKMRGLDGR